MRIPFLLPLLLFSVSCKPTPEPTAEPISPPLISAADSLAFRILQNAGGMEAWEALQVLRFDWVSERDTGEVFRARHLWDKASGAYRVEYPVGEDSMMVAMFVVTGFDPAAPNGKAYVNGIPVDSTHMADRLNEAYERFINDSYWLLAPLKLFDPGVQRNLAPDSADAGSQVLMLSFENVGLTPGDRYWIRADPAGSVMSWSYRLEGGSENHYQWMDFQEIPTPAGMLRLTSRKQAGGRAILTEVLPSGLLDPDIFLDPNPRL